jgi:hypothetical protein
VSKETIATCDRCKQQLPYEAAAQTYDISKTLSVAASMKRAPTHFDLCDECAGLLGTWLENALVGRATPE